MHTASGGQQARTPASTAGLGTLPSGARERPPRLVVIFAVVTFALTMQSVDSTIVATALHALQRGLGTSVNWAGWTISAYAVGLMLALPVSARLSERLGPRRVFLVSVAAFTAASLCCGLALNIFVLIALRAIQAAAGAGLTPSATSIIVDHFGRARDRAVGLFGASFQVGAMAGPVLGGLIVAKLSWRWIFFVNVPIGIALLLFAVRVIPPDKERPTSARVPLDLRGMGLLGVGILTGMIGVTYLGEPEGWAPAVAAVGIVTAGVFIWRFVRRAKRVAHPFVAPRLIYGRGFGAVNVINLLYGGAVIGLISLVPLYAINRYHIGVLASGTLLTAQAIAAAVFSVIGAFVIRRTGYRAPMYVGALFAAVGVFALAVGPQGVSAYVWLAAATLIVGIGNGWSNPASRNAGLQLVPEHSASVAALRTMGRQVGTIATVAIVTAVIAGAADPNVAQAYAFAGFGALLLLVAPVIARVPEHRGSW